MELGDADKKGKELKEIRWRISVKFDKQAVSV